MWLITSPSEDLRSKSSHPSSKSAGNSLFSPTLALKSSPTISISFLHDHFCRRLARSIAIILIVSFEEITQQYHFSTLGVTTSFSQKFRKLVGSPANVEPCFIQFNADNRSNRSQARSSMGLGVIPSNETINIIAIERARAGSRRARSIVQLYLMFRSRDY